jgi:hypothetical protein
MMMKLTLQHFHSQRKLFRAVFLAVVLTAAPLVSDLQVGAAPITTRSVTLSSSVGDATGVTYSLSTAALPTIGTAVKSVEILMCTTVSGACTKPVGFANNLSTLASQPTGLGAGTGWTVNAATDGSLRIVNAANATNPSGVVAIVWNAVHNPTATNTTFYGRITTYSGSGWTGALDTGTVALSTSAQIQVALAVNESLTFCTGTSITGQNCGTAAGSLVDLGNGSTTATATGTSIMAASTNGSSGYTITINGTTLTSGANTITALSSGGTSVIGSSQFGVNVASANTTPVVGAAVSGAGTGAGSANYAINNTFRYATGETIASAAGPTNANTFTVGYIANISGLTLPGAYTTNVTYIATANF